MIHFVPCLRLKKQNIQRSVKISLLNEFSIPLYRKNPLHKNLFKIFGKSHCAEKILKNSLVATRFVIKNGTVSETDKIRSAASSLVYRKLLWIQRQKIGYCVLRQVGIPSSSSVVKKKQPTSDIRSEIWIQHNIFEHQPPA